MSGSNLTNGVPAIVDHEVSQTPGVNQAVDKTRSPCTVELKVAYVWSEQGSF